MASGVIQVALASVFAQGCVYSVEIVGTIQLLRHPPCAYNVTIRKIK